MINDIVHITNEDAEKFEAVCRQVSATLPLSKSSEEVRHSITPADIFFADTIPLKEVVLRCNSIRYEISFSDTPTIRVADDKGMYPTATAYILSQKGDDVLYVDPAAEIYGMRPNSEQLITHEGLFKPVNQQLGYALRVWYGIQIMLLNPYVKDVFRTVDKKETHFNPNGKKRKYRVCYVRHHYLNPEAQIGLGTTADGGKMRHTLAWYVCGHWRHYSDGKVIFIQPYWKGPLRETKACEPRERIVDATITA